MLCPQAKIIHIDIDHSELDKIKTAQVGIRGDVAEVLDALSPQVACSRPDWRARVAELKAAFPKCRVLTIRVRRTGLIRAVAECVGDAASVVTDVGQHQMGGAGVPAATTAPVADLRRLGHDGLCLPAAIGAALAESRSAPSFASPVTAAS